MLKNDTTTDPTKLGAFLGPSNAEIDYDKFDAEKQADIRENVASGMIDYDAVADTASAEAIHKILLGDEDLNTGLIEGKEALEIDTESMRRSIIDDDSYSEPEKTKYLRTMQIFESIENNGFSLIRTDSGRYWIESKVDGKREYAINAIQEVADLLDKYVTGAPEETTPEGEGTIVIDDSELPASKEIELPRDNTNIEEYVPDEIDFSSSDMYYLASIGVDLVSTMAGLGVKVTTTAPTAGIGYLGGAAVSVGGGIAATVLGAIGDAKNDDVTTGEMWGNILISLGLEGVEGFTSVPMNLSRNIHRGLGVFKKLIRYGVGANLVGSAAAMEWDRLLSKEEWTANDYRELASLGQFVLSGVSSYYAGRHGKNILKRQARKVSTDNTALNKAKKVKLKESTEYKKITSEGNEGRNRMKADAEAAGKARAKTETDIMKADTDAKTAKLKQKLNKDIDAVKESSSSAKAKATRKAFEDRKAGKIKKLKDANTAKIAELDAEFKANTASSEQRFTEAALESPEYLKNVRDSKKVDRSRRKEFVSEMDESKQMKANRKELEEMGKSYQSAHGKKQRQETESEMYAESLAVKQKGAPEGVGKKQTKLVAKQNKNSAKEYGKDQTKKAEKRRASEDAKDKKNKQSEKKESTATKKIIEKQKAELQKLETKKATEVGLTASEQKEYDKLSSSISKLSAKTPKAKGKLRKKAEGIAQGAYDTANKTYNKAGDRVKNAASTATRWTGISNDARTSSSMAKVYKQALMYDSDITGERLDKLDLQGARKAAERLGFDRREIAGYTLGQLKAAIKARRKEDKEKRSNGGKLVPKFQDGSKIQSPVEISNEDLETIMVSVFDNFDYKTKQQLDNAVLNSLPKGVVLSPEQSQAMLEAYNAKASAFDNQASIELKKANPMAKLKPFLENLRPSDFFMRNEIFTEVPNRDDVIAPQLRARPVENMASYQSAINSTYKQPKLDMSDGMGARVMQQKYADAGARQRQEINTRNNQYVQQQKQRNNAITNQNIASSAQAHNQNVLARNQASDIYAQERVKALAAQQTMRNKQWGNIGNSLQRVVVQNADQKAKTELGEKINTLAGLRQVYATEYAPLVKAAVKANNPFKATSIKRSFMEKHNRNPDMLNVDLMNLSDEMKLFES